MYLSGGVKGSWRTSSLVVFCRLIMCTLCLSPEVGEGLEDSSGINVKVKDFQIHGSGTHTVNDKVSKDTDHYKHCFLIFGYQIASEGFPVDSSTAKLAS